MPGDAADCATRKPFEITSITGHEGLSFVGKPITLTIDVEDSDGVAVDVDTLSVTFASAGGPRFERTETSGVFTDMGSNPTQIGGYGYVVVATDGCRLAVGDFSLELAQYTAWLSLVHIAESAPASVSLQRHIDPTELHHEYVDIGFGQASNFQQWGVREWRLQVRTPNDDQNVTAGFDVALEHDTWHTVVLFDAVGDDNITHPAVALITDNTDPVDLIHVTARAVIFHGVIDLGTFDVLSPFGPIATMQDVTFGALSASETLDAEVAIPVFLDLNGDSAPDYTSTVEVPYNEVATFFMYRDGGAIKSLSRSIKLQLNNPLVTTTTVDITPAGG